MMIREAEYKACGECGLRQLSKDEVHGCDQCRTVIDFNKKNVKYHDLTVFAGNDTGNTRHIFCSVECVMKWLRAFKPPKNYRFMSLPLFSGRTDLRRVQEHLK